MFEHAATRSKNMNAIRARIVAYWLLLAAWGILLCLHHNLLAWFLFFPTPFLRHITPKLPKPSRRNGYFLGGAVIAYLVLVFIDSLYPFPAVLVKIGNVFAVATVLLLVCHAAYLDWQAFKSPHANNV